jgi:hypothetical protein
LFLKWKIFLIPPPPFIPLSISWDIVLQANIIDDRRYPKSLYVVRNSPPLDAVLCQRPFHRIPSSHLCMCPTELITDIAISFPETCFETSEEEIKCDMGE